MSVLGVDYDLGRNGSFPTEMVGFTIDPLNTISVVGNETGQSFQLASNRLKEPVGLSESGP